MTTETETWVTVQEFVKRPQGTGTPHLEVSNMGRVRRNGVIWEPCRSSSKYPCLMLNRQQHALHRLVCEIFNGPRPAGMECFHKDGNPANNRADNLQWGTASERHLNSVRRGTNAALKRRGMDGQKGEANGAAKLTNRKVREIRHLYTTGATQKGLGRKFRVGKSTIGRIVRRTHWKHVQ